MEKELSRITKNGTKIFSYKNKSIHGCHISLYVKAGCMYESAEENGITHFLEHVLYRNVNAMMDGNLYSTLDRCAIELGAATYNEMMHFNVSGEKSGFFTMADIITHTLSPIIISNDEFKAELGRIKAEIRESDDRTSLSTFVGGIAYEGTPLSRTILGTVGGISRITRTRLENYRKRIFTPDNLFFYVTGNFGEADLDYLESAIDSHELSFGSGNENVAQVPAKFGKRDACVYVKNADFTMVRFSFDMDMSHIGRGEDDLLYDILLGGNNSRFYIEMSEQRGMFYDISGSVEKYRNIGTFAFTYEVRAGSVYDAIKLTLAILAKMKKSPLPEEDTMKAGYSSGAPLLLDDPRELGYTMAYENHILDYGLSSVTERAKMYSAITPESIMMAAREIFRPENLVLGVKGNKRKIDQKRIERILADFAEGNLDTDEI